MNVGKPDHRSYSGIFGYINYLVEKDRRFIIETLLNGNVDHFSTLSVYADHVS